MMYDAAVRVAMSGRRYRDYATSMCHRRDRFGVDLMAIEYLDAFVLFSRVKAFSNLSQRFPAQIAASDGQRVIDALRGR